ncbi:MAG: hypothetical protein QOH70_1125 [Blastocatellia bacterium]|jgi:hypothetical protein|nr:hypothetical protein [Blastocatellia bacterium]
MKDATEVQWKVGEVQGTKGRGVGMLAYLHVGVLA